MRFATLFLVLCLSVIAGPVDDKQTGPGAAHDWPNYGGTAENNRFSPLSQINRSNVQQLQVAWTYDTEESGGLQSSPIIVDGVLYGLTPSERVFALNAATGNLLWKFDSGVKGTQPDRGLAYWAEESKPSKKDSESRGTESPASEFHKNNRRILVAVMNFVYALDASTGQPIASFGKDGRIDLRDDLGRDPAEQSIYVTTPPVIYKDLMIVGGRESETLPASPGDIRAYDVRSGKLRWSFHTIPHPGEFGEASWPKGAWKTSGAANNWAGMTVDVARGIVYVPTGSAAFDFYGADRLGDDLFANTLLALNAETGERIWHFQGVKHDLWDRDFPAPPVLLTVNRDGQKVDAVAQTTKQGFVFLFDRTDGAPLFPIECRKYPPSDVPGEVAAQQQCLPSKPAPYARQLLTAEMLTERTPEAHQWALEKFRSFRSEGQFVPFSVGKDTVIFPGFDGGAEWGGAAADPDTGILYVNANEMAWTGALAENSAEDTPKALYLNQCAVCHGEKMAGSPPAIPALIGVSQRMSYDQVAATIKNGKGRMPGFANLENDSERWYGLLGYVMSGGANSAEKEAGKKEERKDARNEMASSGPASPAMKYHFTGYHRFLDPEGYPAIAPPWGTLNAIDLNTGEFVWKIPLGEYPDLAAKGQKNTGSENYGGPVVTAGGVVFIAATNYDKKFRAFDKSTGALLWETTLPFSANTTPAVYEVDGQEFVAIAAGGGKDPKSKSGGVYVAFSLKK